MDRGILAIWYDLPTAGQVEHVAWLHEQHLPAILADREDILWAAHFQNLGRSERFIAMNKWMARADADEVSSGMRYLLLFGAESPYAFFNPTVQQVRDTWNSNTKAMVDQRIGTNIGVFAEEVRVDGPSVESRAPGLTPGPYIQMGNYQFSATGDAHDLGHWYTQTRLPFARQMPGCVGARKLIASAGWGQHAVLYEFVSADVREERWVAHEEEGMDDPVWKHRVLQHIVHGPASPFVGPRLWPPVE
jgi:hypothetical protein